MGGASSVGGSECNGCWEQRRRCDHCRRWNDWERRSNCHWSDRSSETGSAIAVANGAALGGAALGIAEPECHWCSITATVPSCKQGAEPRSLSYALWRTDTCAIGSDRVHVAAAVVLAYMAANADFDVVPIAASKHVAVSET